MPAVTFDEIIHLNDPVEESNCSIFKTDDDKRLVFGWASVIITVDGEQLEDRQQDVIDPDDLEEAAYEYVLNFRDTGEEHIPTLRLKGKLVESCVFTEEKQRAMGIPAGIIPVGWWVGFKIYDDAAWALVKNGTYKMFSIEGKAERHKIEKGQLKGCGVLVVQDGKILAGTRIERSGKGQICGPGGHIDEGEEPEEAAKREAFEEFGITCEELTSLGTVRNGTSAIFWCEKFSGTPKTDEVEMTDPQWFTIEELQEMDLHPAFGESLDFIETEAEEPKTVAKTFNELLEDIEKFNPFHGTDGRFTSANGAASFTYTPGKSKAHDNAIAREKQRQATAGTDSDEMKSYIASLKPDVEYPERVDHWKKQIQAGNDRPILVSSTDENRVIDGNHTLAAYKELGKTPKVYAMDRVEFLLGASEAKDTVEFIRQAIKDGKATEVKKEGTVAKTFEEVLKFNPFHDAKGRFSSSNGFATYSANPKTKAGAMAISRSAQAGHGYTFNSHKESQGENIDQNYKWLSGGPGAKQLAAQGQLASQQPKTPPKPQKNYDKLGYADYDDADYHQLYNGRQYFQQQKLTASQQKAATNYLEDHPEPGSLYSHSQNMNYQMAQGQTLTGKYKQTHDGLMSAMHNVGYNVELTRYDHDGMVNGLLKTLGAGTSYEKMSQAALTKALVGVTVNENKFLSTSYNNFKNAPQSTKQVFDTRAVKINYKVKADVQAMMPGKGPGGDFGEMILAPTNGTSNRGGKITAVRLTNQMVRRKGTQTYNQPRIEIDIEI